MIAVLDNKQPKFVTRTHKPKHPTLTLLTPKKSMNITIQPLSIVVQPELIPFEKIEIGENLEELFKKITIDLFKEPIFDYTDQTVFLEQCFKNIGLDTLESNAYINFISSNSDQEYWENRIAKLIEINSEIVDLKTEENQFTENIVLKNETESQNITTNRKRPLRELRILEEESIEDHSINNNQVGENYIEEIPENSTIFEEEAMELEFEITTTKQPFHEDVEPSQTRKKRFLDPLEKHHKPYKPDIISNIENKNEADLKYYEFINLVPYILKGSDIELIENNPLGDVFKEIQKNNNSTLEPFTESLFREEEDNEIGSDQPNEVAQVLESLHETNLDLPYTEEEIEQALKDEHFRNTNTSPFEILDAEDKSLIHTQSQEMQAYLKYNSKERKFSFEDFQFLEQTIYERTTNFFKHENLEKIRSLISSYDQLLTIFKQYKEQEVAVTIQETKNELFEISEVFKEVYSEVKILLEGGDEILSYIKTKTDWNLHIKDNVDKLEDILTKYEAVGSVYTKEFFVLANQFMDFHREHKDQELTQYVKNLAMNDPLNTEIKNIISKYDGGIIETVRSYYIEFKSFLNSEIFQNIKSYVATFFPILKDIVEITTGFDIYKAGTVIEYAQQAIEIVDAWIFTEESGKDENSMNEADQEYIENKNKHNDTLEEYYNNTNKPR